MSEIIKSPAMLILILVVVLIVLFVMFEFLFGVKIGRGTCKFVGTLVFTALSPLLSGITQYGVTGGCDLLPF